MKIIFFNYLFLEYGGGTAQYFIDVARGLKKRYPTLEINIVTFDRKFSQKILNIYSLYFLNKEVRIARDNELTKDILSKLKGVKYSKAKNVTQLRSLLSNCDFIYSKNDFVESFILKFIVRYKRIPRVIMGFHTPVFYSFASSIQSKLHNFIYKSAIYKYLISDVWKIHVLNSFDERLLKKLIPNIKIIKIFNPFNFAEYRGLSNRYFYEFDVDSKKFNILWLGRLTEQKGVDDLIFIINNINMSELGDKIVWNIVGDGHLRSVFLSSIKSWHNVRYCGYIRHDLIPSIMVKQELLISTSRWESFPYNLLEAQSLGLPVICYNIHGSNDIIKDGLNGFLVSNIYEFIYAIKKYVVGKKIRKYKLYRYISSKFNEDKIYKDIYNLFGVS